MSCPTDIASKAYVDSEIAEVKEAIYRLMSEYVKQSEKPQIIEASVTRAESEIMPQVDGLIKAAIAVVMFYIQTQINSVKSIIGTLEDIINGVKVLAQGAYDLAKQAVGFFQKLAGVFDKVASLESQITGILSRLSAVETLANSAKTLAQEAKDLVIALKADIAAKITAINTEISNIKADIVAKITAINTTITNLKADIAAKITAINTEISNIKADIAAKITAINTTITNLKADIAAKITAINTAISGLKTDISKIMEYIPIDFSGIQRQINNLKATVTSHIGNTFIHNTADKIYNFIDKSVTNYFTGNVNYVTNIINNIGSKVDLSPITNKLNQIDSKIIAMGVSVGVILQGNNTIREFTRTTQQQTTRDAITSAAASGTCQSLNGNCGTNFMQRMLNGFKNNLDAVFSGANLASFSQWRAGEWTNFYRNEWGSNFFSWYQSSLKPGFDHLYNNAKNGIDRTLQILNVALALHNAQMLSSNVGQTVTYLVDSVLQNFGLQFQTKEGTAVSFSQVVGMNINAFLESVLGEELWTGTQATFKKASRTYQAAMQMIWQVRAVIDTVQDTTDTILDNTGKIGNALRDSGVFSVFTNRFPDTNIRQSATTAKINNLSEGLRGFQEGAEILTEISENTLETKENLRELRESKEAFDAHITDWQDGVNSQDATDRQNSNTPNLNEIDLVKRPPE